MGKGWLDSFGQPGQQGADMSPGASQDARYDATNHLYKGTDGGTGLTANVDFNTESQYGQQGWTKTTQNSSQATRMNEALS
jgi:hypothetical protein